MWLQETWAKNSGCIRYFSMFQNDSYPYSLTLYDFKRNTKIWKDWETNLNSAVHMEVGKAIFNVWFRPVLALTWITSHAYSTEHTINKEVVIKRVSWLGSLRLKKKWLKESELFLNLNDYVMLAYCVLCMFPCHMEIYSSLPTAWIQSSTAWV